MSKHLGMALPLVSLLLLGISALVNKSGAECCTPRAEIIYKMDTGNCKDVGGYGLNRTRCEITICADGMKRVGTYCGQGSCNIFGCNCDGGCLRGEWTQSFLRRNLGYGIETLEEIHYWGEGLYFPQKMNMIVIKNSKQT